MKGFRLQRMLLSDFVELFFLLSLTLQTGPQKATQCDVTGKTKEIFFPTTQHWPQCWKARDYKTVEVAPSFIQKPKLSTLPLPQHRCELWSISDLSQLERFLPLPSLFPLVSASHSYTGKHCHH